MFLKRQEEIAQKIDDDEMAKKERLKVFEKKKESIDEDDFSRFLARNSDDVVLLLKNDSDNIRWNAKLGMQNLNEKEHGITAKYAHGSQDASKASCKYITKNEDLKKYLDSLDSNVQLDRTGYAVARLVQKYFECKANDMIL